MNLQILGRMFDFQVLDMVEFGIEQSTFVPSSIFAVSLFPSPPPISFVFLLPDMVYLAIILIYFTTFL